MCGITGHVVSHGRQADFSAVSAATERLAHRGPNDGNVARLGAACLGHRRLSIIDIEGSPQPWSSDNGRYTIVFNGEIYNYLELRKDLEASGVRFRSQGDTEVLLAMYIRHGERCLEKLNGMFAFAVWDKTGNRLFAARDRLGKKPFFYASADGGIAFASEIEAMLAFRVGRDIDPTAVQDFFAYQFIPSPRTIYRAVRKLPAGHFLRFENGRIEVERYWAPPLPAEQSETWSNLCGEVRRLVEDAVRLRLRSDVPLGAFLSGGLDSSIIAGVMAKQCVDVNTFHVGFDDASYDESDYARTAASHFGTLHHTQTLPIDVTEVLDNAIYHFGEPFADPSAIPTWHLCRYTRQEVTVALSGDGADEVFAGYRRYYARKFVSRYLSLPPPIRRLVHKRLLRWLPDSKDYYGGSWIKKLRLFVEFAERTAVTPNDLLAQTFSMDERRALLAEQVVVKPYNHVADFKLQDLDDVSRMMFTDIQTYLPDDILLKVDRMSMAHALEVRNPFLDHRVVEFACRLPLSYKLNGESQKHILRRAFDDLVPPALLKREKHGFAVPLGRWFSTILAKAFEETVLDATATDWIKRDAALALWRAHATGEADHGFKLWSLFVFHRWYHRRSAA